MHCLHLLGAGGGQGGNDLESHKGSLAGQTFSSWSVMMPPSLTQYKVPEDDSYGTSAQQH